MQHYAHNCSPLFSSISTTLCVSCVIWNTYIIRREAPEIREAPRWRNWGEISVCVCVCVCAFVCGVCTRRQRVKDNYGCLSLHVGHTCGSQLRPTLSYVGPKGAAVSENCDWFVYGDRRECASAALPRFGVVCAVFTADYMGPSALIFFIYRRVCLIFVVLIVCVCFCPCHRQRGLYRCSVTCFFCPRSLVAFKWVNMIV